MNIDLDKARVYLYMPCEHGHEIRHKLDADPDCEKCDGTGTTIGVSGSDAYAIDCSGCVKVCMPPYRKELELKEVGGMYEHPWTCNTCGTEHAGAGCDNPDFGEWHQWYEVIG